MQHNTGLFQGFRDGASGIYGNKITTSILHRLEESHPSQDDYRQGYIEGFRDAASQGQDTAQSTHLTDRLTEISERLSTLERPVSVSVSIQEDGTE